MPVSRRLTSISKLKTKRKKALIGIQVRWLSSAIIILQQLRFIKFHTRARSKSLDRLTVETSFILGFSNPAKRSLHIHALSALSVLCPGTYLICRALTIQTLSSGHSSTLYTGFQYTPVLSIATWVTPFSISHSFNSVNELLKVL